MQEFYHSLDRCFEFLLNVVAQVVEILIELMPELWVDLNRWHLNGISLLTVDPRYRVYLYHWHHAFGVNENKIILLRFLIIVIRRLELLLNASMRLLMFSLSDRDRRLRSGNVRARFHEHVWHVCYSCVVGGGEPPTNLAIIL